MRPLPGFIALLIVLSIGGPAAGLGAASGGSGPQSPATAPHAVPQDRADYLRQPPNASRPDPAVVITINLRENGDARWSVASRFNVSNDTDIAAFRAFAATLRDGGTNNQLGYSAETFERFATIVESETNRSDDMAIRDPEWTSTVTNGTGIISLSFIWTNFARTSGTRVILDDVFTAGNGTLLQSIDDNQRLVINAPPGFAVRESRFPVGENATITLDGPQYLDLGETPIEYAPITNPTTSTTTTTTTRTALFGGPFTWYVGAGLFLLLVATMVGLVLYSRRNLSPGISDDGPATGANAEPDAQGSPDGGEAAVGVAGATAGDSGSGSDSAAAGTGQQDTPVNGALDGAGAVAAGHVDADGTDVGELDDDDDDDIDVELLSDEERVERLLAGNGGRMKQANIVSETGWSNAKVSQLLSAMAEDGRVNKLRIGRENLITLPDEDVGEIE